MTRKKAAHLLSERELEAVARHFRILAEPMRLRILQSICREPKTVTEIIKDTGATQTNVSKHLALLTLTKIVSRRKAGAFVYYKLEDALTLKLCRLVHAESRARG